MQSIFDGIQVSNFFNLRVFFFILFSKKINMNFILYRVFCLRVQDLKFRDN